MLKIINRDTKKGVDICGGAGLFSCFTRLLTKRV